MFLLTMTMDLNDSLYSAAQTFTHLYTHTQLYTLHLLWEGNPLILSSHEDTPIILLCIQGFTIPMANHKPRLSLKQLPSSIAMTTL